MSSDKKDYKDVPDFEGFYKINPYGRFKAMDRVIETQFGRSFLKQNVPQTYEKNGVRYAILRNSKFKNVKINVDKMINSLFEKPKHKPFKPKPKMLEPKIKKPLIKNGSKGIAVEQIDNGKVIETFPSFAIAALTMREDIRKISDAAHGVRKFAAGFEWRIKNSNNK